MRFIKHIPGHLLAPLACVVVWLTCGFTFAQELPSPLPLANQSARLLPVQKNSKWGYINSAGEIVIQPSFDSADEFSEGLAFVRYPNRQKPLKPGQTIPELILGAGFIDETGKVVLELDSPAYLMGDRFCEGLTRFWTGQSGRTLYGFIDRSGTVKIKPQFSFAQPFLEGLAAVSVDDKYGFIDKNGEMIITPKFAATSFFSEGYAVVSFDHQKVGFIDKSGEVVIEPQFGNFVGTFFKEDLSLVAFVDGKYGYIDRRGEVTIPMQFDEAHPFSEGLAAVDINGKWGYIDKTGKFVIEPQFRSAGAFAEALAPVNFETGLVRSEQSGLGSGYIDRSGKMVISLPFDSGSSFVNGIASVYVEGKLGYIDKKGTYIWPPTR